jgi:hypothetical protein
MDTATDSPPDIASLRLFLATHFNIEHDEQIDAPLSLDDRSGFRQIVENFDLKPDKYISEEDLARAIATFARDSHFYDFVQTDLGYRGQKPGETMSVVITPDIGTEHDLIVTVSYWPFSLLS